ncbi:hypothetical protein C0992_013226 [Termitomyces sp. T32_za158]|nr:hypothetical protein C0992_013226 [Termitomyces sp. T32_za158]
MELPYVLPIEVSSAHGRAGGVGGDEMSTFTTQVHNYHDSIIAMRVRQFHNEIHRCHAPTRCGYQERVQLSYQEVTLELGSETQVAGAGVGANIPQHLGPPVVVRHQFQRLPAARVPSNPGVMVLLNNASLKLWVIGDIDAAMEGKEAILEAPFVGAYRPSLSGLPSSQSQCSLSHSVLLEASPITLVDVPEDVHLISRSNYLFQSTDGK